MNVSEASARPRAQAHRLNMGRDGDVDGMGWDRMGWDGMLATITYSVHFFALQLLLLLLQRATHRFCFARPATRPEQTRPQPHHPPRVQNTLPCLRSECYLVSRYLFFSLSSHPLPISPPPPSPLLFQAIPCSWPVYRNPRHFWKRLLLRSTEYGARLLLPTDHLLRSSNCYLRFQCPSPLAPTQAQHKHKHTRALAAASQLLVAP